MTYSPKSSTTNEKSPKAEPLGTPGMAGAPQAPPNAKDGARVAAAGRGGLLGGVKSLKNGLLGGVKDLTSWIPVAGDITGVVIDTVSGVTDLPFNLAGAVTNAALGVLDDVPVVNAVSNPVNTFLTGNGKE